ncbi:MAG: hypothetical protein DI603_14995 [Roseateles depolymerans]|uniref:Phage capsid protein n=1 Tax=Roseateles depolymerans TaxID=76731 RepID=A0A2W5DI00_9BURK|nr:MAG: hypothetical protein DI603_14995 [Roseateles depolymerans]
MPIKSKMFRVATEGATTDGRNIERSWLVQAAKNYNRNTFGARVNMEHLRSLYPDSAFRSYGDIVSVEAKEEDGKMRLYAEIAPLPELVALSKAGQKIYTSIEINPKFADTGEAYLVGLAVTDNPASLGTEMLSFAAKNPQASPFASRKSHPDALFSEAVQIDLAFDEEAEDGGKFSAKLREILGKFSAKAKGDDARMGEVVAVLEEVAETVAAQDAAFTAQVKRTDTLTNDLAELKKAFGDLKAVVDKIDKTPAPNYTQRPPATGSNASGAAQTDC